MPLFELPTDGGVKPFRRLSSAAEVYEREIESLFWGHLEAMAGEPLFPLARQPRLPESGIPDLIALDPQGRVVVIEIKRDIDRGQLAQALEYAGWARTTNLDELSEIYAEGPARFLPNWQKFTNTTTPVLVDQIPRLILVSRSFDRRTEAALEYLRDCAVPLKIIQVVFYEDGDGMRIVDVENGELESPQAGGSPGVSPESDWIEGLVASGKRRPRKARAASTSSSVSLMDLLETGLIQPGEPIVWDRPQTEDQFAATISSNGEIVLADGRSYTSLSQAANELAGGSYNGWECWTVPRLNGIKVGSLRNHVDT